MKVTARRTRSARTTPHVHRVTRGSAVSGKVGAQVKATRLGTSAQALALCQRPSLDKPAGRRTGALPHRRGDVMQAHFKVTTPRSGLPLRREDACQVGSCVGSRRHGFAAAVLRP